MEESKAPQVEVIDDIYNEMTEALESKEEVKEVVSPLVYRENPLAMLSAENKYATNKDASELARELISKGQMLEAREAVEAAVKQDPENPTEWRLLGQLHQENDDDD